MSNWPEQRKLTGAFYRVQREGKFEPIDVADMTEAEIRESFTGQTDLVGWIVLLVKTLREVAELTGITKVSA